MLYWSQIPLVRAAIPFAIGIVAAQLWGDSISPIFPFLGVFLLFSFALLVAKYLHKYQYRWVFGLQLNLVFSLLGVLVWAQAEQRVTQNSIPLEQQLFWTATITDLDIGEDNSKSAIADLISVNKDSVFNAANGKIKMYISSEKKLKVGDVIMAKTYLNPISSPKNPAAFDYASYMKRKGVYYRSFTKEFIKIGHHESIQSSADELRNKLIANYQAMGISEDNLGVLVAISLGDKMYLDREIKAKYSGAGAMHILAVSGLHLGIVFLIFSFLLKPLKRLPFGKILLGLCLLILIWSFALLTGFSPSVQRASLMFSFIAIAKMLKYKTNVLNSIAASAFLILLYNPFLLFDVSFQLSYSAVIGIVCLHPIIYNFWRTPNLFIDKIWSLMVVSISAQLATLPFVLYYFHQFPNWFLLTNILVIPLAFVIVAAAVFVSSCYLLFSITLGLNYVLNFAINLLNQSVILVSQLPFFITDDIWISTFSAVLLGMAIVGLIAYLETVNLYYLKAFFTLMVVVFALEFAFKYWQSQKSGFGIYANTSAFVYINGLNATVFTKDTLEYYNKRQIDNHLKSIGIRLYEIKPLHVNEQIKGLQKVTSNNFTALSFKKLVMLFAKSNTDITNKMCEVDYLVLNENSLFEDTLTEDCGLKLILDGSIESWSNGFENLTNKEDLIKINTSGYVFID